LKTRFKSPDRTISRGVLELSEEVERKRRELLRKVEELKAEAERMLEELRRLRGRKE